MTNNTPSQKPEKPWWKKWWVILLIIFGIMFVSALFREGSTNNEASAPKETTVEQAEQTAEEQTEKEQPAEEQPTEEAAPEQPTVSHAGQEWECLPVPDDTMNRIMDGDLWDDGAHAAVEKSVMVQGVDNNFIAASIKWEGEDEAFDADFTTAIDGGGPITSASSGTASLFNWPETPDGPYDGTGAAQKCLKK
ncbi:hypothetical protein ACL1HT_04480 [Corynebacterium striatum]|nr:YpmS family protein [Corynebacterium striatum]HAT6493919.1 YpmS family protein [Corynebacterium striatum]HAT6496231.1 YpmS family protein [Corynebacterium striatum]HAT6620149.1 YpmS family protein [Corynebacterium striatum]HCG3138957.1 hypothetical protein [Corynebacterium striatum]